MGLSEIKWSDVVAVRRLAVGGMASVFLVDRLNSRFRKRIVIKTILEKYISDAAVRDLFIREATRHASLAHPNIVQLFDFGHDSQSLYMALEYVSGGNLSTFSQSEYAKDKREMLARRVIENIGSALSTVHKFMIHGDISPGNILYGPDGSFKLCDFGLARDLLPETSPISDQYQKGTIRYMAPEQISRSHSDIRSDIFSLGITAAEFYSGTRLYGDLPPDQLAHLIRSGAYLKHIQRMNLPESLYDVILRAVQPSPHDRFQSADDLLLALSCQRRLASSVDRSSLDASLRWHDNADRSEPKRVSKLSSLLSLLLTLPTLLLLPLIMLWKKRT